MSLLLGLVAAVYIPFGFVLGPILRWRSKRFLAGAVAPAPEEKSDAADLDVPEGAQLFVVVGEQSGDRLAAQVLRALRARQPSLKIVGYGGPACRDAGMTVYRDLTEHAVMGVSAVIRTLGFWWRVCVETRARLRTERPAVLLTVDFPGLNVCLARWARTLGIRTVHLVAPQLWAHAPWRVFRWRRAVDRLLCTLPFEQPWFSRTGIRTAYVGHPLFEEPLSPPRTAEERPGGVQVVELLPGSRRREIRRNLPMLLDAAREISTRLPDVRLLMRLAELRHLEWVQEVEALARDASHPPMETQIGPPDDESGIVGALATSGTVTAELAVALVPLVTFYGMGPLTRVLAWVGLTTPWFCLANLVAGRKVVPEHLYTLRSASRRIAGDLIAQLESDDAWKIARASLEVVRSKLASPGVADRVAGHVLGMMAAASTTPKRI